ncbi:MAG TPA: carboxypeptidase-like regulatory domain-containing protein [Pyrinomonadaceae bacterium]|nr:carboxypeptidase-like regulatory domain-containing protein [Pyrinomonadaceae bacterium]
MTKRFIGGVLLCLLTAIVASSLSASLCAQTPDNLANSPGEITGHIDVPNGESLSGASVRIGSFYGAIGGQSQALAKIDSSGNFKFTGLPPGLYGVSANVPGLVIAPNPPSAEARRFYRPGDTVNFTLIKGGVITGKVTNAANAPMVAAPVRVVRVADAEGKRLPTASVFGETLTDDRGIYRRYGLIAGTYIVSTGGISRSPSGLSLAYSSDLPTYAPSSTRDTAAEFVVRSGEEVTVDIQYRREAGHAISGAVAGLPESQSSLTPFLTSAFINLVEVKTRAQIANTNASSYTNYGFEMTGLPDGEYELTAQQSDLMSDPMRVSVKGDDVSGITLSLHALASISGHVVFETDPKIDCAKRRATARQETLIAVRRFTAPPTSARSPKETAADVPLLFNNFGRETGLDEKSDFAIKSLLKGNYWIVPQPPDPGWFVKSIEAGAKSTTAKSSANVPRDGVAVGAGERVSNLTVTFTDGAATLKGRVTLQKGEQLPARLRFYLAPAEKESSEDVLRFFEVGVQRDGTFSIGNITPGRYFVITRPAEDVDATTIKSVKHDTAFRNDILKAATSLNRQVTFKPCEQNGEYESPLSASTSPQ